MINDELSSSLELSYMASMARKPWIVAWKDSVVKPAFYHCISRVVDKPFVFGQDEKEKFRTLMRMQENFTGCRVVYYCLMSNHIHLLVEVPPAPEGGLSDDGVLERLRSIYHEAAVEEVAKELADARRLGAAQRVAGAAEKVEVRAGRDGQAATRCHRQGLSAGDQARQGELSLGKMLRCRVRYFTDGAVVGSRSFVNEAFAAARERFGSRRKDGARKLRGSGAAGTLWSARDLKKGVG